MPTRPIATVLLLSALASGLAPRPAAAGEETDSAAAIAWETAYAAAVKKAQADERPLLLKFYTGWCPHCVRMDRTTWKDDKVAKLAESFVAAKVNADVEKVPVKRYHLTGYPTVIVAEPSGEEVLRLEGYKNAEVIAAYLQAYRGKEKEIAAAHAALRQDRRDAEAHLTLGRFYRDVGLHDRAEGAFKSALKAAEGGAWLEATTGAGECLVEKGEFKAAAKLLEPALERAGAAPPAALLLAVGRARAGLGRTEDARGAWNRVIAAHDGTPEADRARSLLAAL